MMKLKKIGAILLAVMMTAICTVAWAADGLNDGKFGTFSPADTVTTSSTKAINIKKELYSDNANDLSVFAPTISYTYEITAGGAGKTIKDATSAHSPAASVTTTTIAGVTTGLTYTTSISWSPANTLTDGANTQNIVVDFSNVIFTGTGVYRYVITEKTAGKTDSTEIANAYTAAGVTAAATGTQIRYLDVYVKPSDSFAPLSDTKTAYVAGDWDIYGYVCFTNNNSIDATATGTTAPAESAAGKTNGFVGVDANGDGDYNDEGETPADTYYTFNVTISKTLTGDNYSNSHEFPVHVNFTNASVTTGTKLNAEVSTSGATDYTHNVGDVSALDGLAKIANGGSIKYIGIPCGTQVDVYETNDVTGTTYAATLTVDGTEGATKSIVSTSTPTAFAEYTEQDYNSLKGTITTTADAADATTVHTIEIANVMRLISPTGYVARYAPYGLILVGGIVLLIIAKKHKKHTEEE